MLALGKESFARHYSRNYVEEEIGDIAGWQYTSFDREGAIGYRFNVAEVIEEYVKDFFSKALKIELSIQTAQKELEQEEKDFPELESTGEKLPRPYKAIPNRFTVIKDVAALGLPAQKRAIEKLLKKSMDINAKFVVCDRDAGEPLRETFELRLSWSKFNNFEEISKKLKVAPDEKKV